MWLQLGRFPIKFGWQDPPLALRTIYLAFIIQYCECLVVSRKGRPNTWYRKRNILTSVSVFTKTISVFDKDSWFWKKWVVIFTLTWSLRTIMNLPIYLFIFNYCTLIFRNLPCPQKFPTTGLIFILVYHCLLEKF